MWKRRLLYAAAMIGGIVFYLAYQEWFSWVALIAILFLPAAALLLSLPAMVGLRLRYSVSREVEVGTPLALSFDVRCRLPAPPYRCRVKVSQAVTGLCETVEEGKPLPTAHCGVLVCKPYRPNAYDYLGLFGLRILEMMPVEILVYPRTQKVENLPGLERFRSKAWKPKHGGGFAENHEIRLYRPGDALNQIHWKLSAKTGQLVIREPMVPVNERVLVELVLRGSPDALDRKLGQLLWLCGHLLEKDIPHEVRVLTGDGVRTLTVTDPESLHEAMRAVLFCRAAGEDAVLEPVNAGWLYRIGGDGGEE